MGENAETEAPTAEQYRLQAHGPGLSVAEMISRNIAAALVRHVEMFASSPIYADDTLIRDVGPFPANAGELLIRTQRRRAMHTRFTAIDDKSGPYNWDSSEDCAAVHHAAHQSLLRTTEGSGTPFTIQERAYSYCEHLRCARAAEATARL
jgi:hypothetical protein